MQLILDFIRLIWFILGYILKKYEQKLELPQTIQFLSQGLFVIWSMFYSPIYSSIRVTYHSALPSSLRIGFKMVPARRWAKRLLASQRTKTKITWLNSHSPNEIKSTLIFSFFSLFAVLTNSISASNGEHIKMTIRCLWFLF